MTFDPFKPGNFAEGERLLHDLHVNYINEKFPFIPDGEEGGEYDPASPLSITKLQCPTVPATGNAVANKTYVDTGVDIQVFTTVGAGTWTKPAWATATTPVRAIVVSGGGGGAGGGVTTSGGAGAGSVPMIGEYLAGGLAATEGVVVGSAGTAGFEANGGGGGTSTFASGKDYITVSAVNGGGVISGGHGGNGGNGGGGGSSGGSGSGGNGGSGGGAGLPASAGTAGTPGTGMFGAATTRFIGACMANGSGGGSAEGGHGGKGWGAGGGGGAAQSVGITGGGGGGSGWTGYQGYPTAGDGEDRDGSSTNGGVGTQGIVIVITGYRVA